MPVAASGGRRFPRWTWARRLVALAFLAVLGWGAVGASPWVRGSTAATRLFDVVPFVDPLAALEVGLSTGHLTATMLLGSGLLVGVTLLLGPVFCGWLCPLGFLLDLGQGFRAFLRRRFGHTRKQPVRRQLPAGSRIATLGFFLGLALVTGLPLFQTVSPIHLVVRALLFGSVLGLVVVAGIAVLEVFFPRIWCREICPLGALYGLLGRFAPWRVRIDPHLAGRAPCRMCTVSCPMGIRVMEDYTLAGKASVDDARCTRCGSCLDACPRGVLSLSFRATTRDAGHDADVDGTDSLRSCDELETRVP